MVKKKVSKTIKSKARKLCREHYNNTCAITGCTDPRNLEVHHIVPLCYGGSWDISNLILLRRDIHRAVHDKRIEVAYEYISAVEKLRNIIASRKKKR